LANDISGTINNTLTGTLKVRSSDTTEYVTNSALEAALLNYIEKETGKGLSTHDLTDGLYIMLTQEAHWPQSDWDEADENKRGYILNKPTLAAFEYVYALPNISEADASKTYVLLNSTTKTGTIYKKVNNEWYKISLCSGGIVSGQVLTLNDGLYIPNCVNLTQNQLYILRDILSQHQIESTSNISAGTKFYEGGVALENKYLQKEIVTTLPSAAQASANTLYFLNDTTNNTLTLYTLVGAELKQVTM
jgi:hypothetical protein